MTSDRYRKAIFRLALAAALLTVAPVSFAGLILPGTWYEFGFTDVGVPATGCFPDDPGGNFCIPSSGTPTQFLDAPPWTFTAASAATLTVTDAFASGDRFEVFDLGVSIGLTSLPTATALIDCGDDPVVCLATAGMSIATFVLAAGPHSITLVPVLSPGGLGSAYLLVAAAVVPEPGSLWLASLGLLGLSVLRVGRMRA
jgi:hypothetical protein